MTKRFITFSLFLLMCALGSLHIVQPAHAAETDAFRSTPFPLPRFVSLSSNKIYVRSGPGQRYPVKWVFKKKGLPAEVILEYQVWRKIKDYEGQVGWIHQSLTSGRRTGLIQTEDLVSVYKKPNESSRLVAYLESNVVGQIETCEVNWCLIDASGYKGWVQKEFIWGVYKNETF